MIKKISELDFYEVLNLRPDATPEEIEKAYLQALSTYHEESLASYGGLSSEERTSILKRIEEAFATLSNPEKRKPYDARIMPNRPEGRQRAYFRISTVRMEIEDAAEEKSFWNRLKDSFFFRRDGKFRPHRDLSADRQRESMPERDPLYSAESLKILRLQKGLKLEEVAGRLKIRASLLQALENEDHSLLSGKMRLHLLKEYARSLGLIAARDTE